MKLNHSRHAGIFDAENYSAVIVGAGGIGALTALTLAKMGLSYITIFDGDFVDGINLATQFHRMDEVGSPKVDAVLRLIGQMADTQVTAMPVMATESEDLTANFIISAVDSIVSRQIVWGALLKSNWSWYLDARMSAEIFSLHTVRNGEHEWYGRQILSLQEDDVPDVPCTMKATIYTANFAAAHVGCQVRRIITGVHPPRLIYHDILANSVVTQG